MTTSLTWYVASCDLCQRNVSKGTIARYEWESSFRQRISVHVSDDTWRWNNILSDLCGYHWTN